MPPSPDPSQPEQAADDAPSSTLAIETHGLSKHFGQRKAVDGLTIRIPAGTIAGFVGPNGAGKTTTIRLLLGLLRPSAGRATILGQPLTHPERYPVRKYSQGMKQRLGVAMALLPDPDLLILDEPANGLDPLGIIQMRDLLRRLREQGKTIFISSHLLGELEQITDWLVMLHQGKALFSGPARDLLDRRGELVVEAEEATQLDVVARLAREAGYPFTQEDHS